MKTHIAIELEGTASSLAKLLGISPSAISQWGPDVPQQRVWQLKVLRPSWFPEAGNQPAPQPDGAAHA